MRHEKELSNSELEISKNLGFAICGALSDLPVSHQLSAAVMCVTHIINSGSRDAEEARKILADFRDTVDLELSAMRALLAA